MLPDMLKVVGRLKLLNLPGFRVHDPDHAVIKIDLIVPVHQAHVIGHGLISIAQNQVDISLIFEDHFLEELQCEFRKLHVDLGHLQDFLSLFLGDPLAHASGQTPNEMGRPSCKDLLSFLCKGSVLDDLFSYIQAHLINQTEDIPLRRVRIRAENKVGSG